MEVITGMGESLGGAGPVFGVSCSRWLDPTGGLSFGLRCDAREIAGKGGAQKNPAGPVGREKSASRRWNSQASLTRRSNLAAAVKFSFGSA